MPISAGIVPASWLSASASNSRSLSAPISGGIGPDNWLPFGRSHPRADSDPIAAGVVPENRLYRSLRDCRYRACLFPVELARTTRCRSTRNAQGSSISRRAPALTRASSDGAVRPRVPRAAHPSQCHRRVCGRGHVLCGHGGRASVRPTSNLRSTASAAKSGPDFAHPTMPVTVVLMPNNHALLFC